MTSRPSPKAQSPAPAAVPELLDAQEVANLLQCSARHVLRLASDGRAPPPIRIGNLVRWSRAAITSWIDAGCPAAKPGDGAAPERSGP